MKALVEKEIRMLLPAFAGAILLAVLPVWLFPYDAYTHRDYYSIYFFCFGVALLAVSTFGREIGLKTLPFMLAQPVARGRVWRTKAAVLGFFVSMTFIGWWLSRLLLSLHQWVPGQSLAEVLVFVAAMVAGALWMTLLLKQVAAAFWLTFLVPMVTVVLIRAAGGADWVVFTILAVYAVVGVFMARRQFVGLQDTAWTGGIVTLAGRWAAAGGETLRERKPWGTLIRKELKLQEFTLAGMAGLFVVHLGVVMLRKLGAESFGKTTLSTLEMFGVVWFFVPLVAGGQSVAEERQLGTLDGLLCLPFSRRVQFWVKFLFVMLVGGLLSATLQRAAESIAPAIGAGKGMGFVGSDPGFLLALLWFLGLSLAGFWASTLTRSVVQAMAAGVVISLMFFGLLRLGIEVPRMWEIVAYPSALITIIWLAYGNFRWVFESGRRWRRNIFVVPGVLLVTLGLTEAANYRIWEYVMPVDGTHGPARLPVGNLQWSGSTGGENGPGNSLSNKPLAIHGYGGTGLAVVFPDGRLWTDRIAYDHGWLSLAGDQFAPGSNWVDGYADSRDTVAIRSDGTLWVSEKPLPPWVDERPPPPQPPAPLVQFGTESDWKSVTRHPTLLLKRDGTLWRWGTNDFDNKYYAGLRSFTPKRIEISSGWDRIYRGEHSAYGWKQDGSAWAVQIETLHATRSDVSLPALDNFHVRSLNSYPFAQNIDLCVRDDGTIWYWGLPDFRYPQSNAIKVVQVGKQSDWAEVAGGIYQLVGLKTDGSMWSWNLLKGNYAAPVEALQEAPRRIGKRDDWVGISLWLDQSVGLAADGTFWHLPGTGVHIGWGYDTSEPWLAPSRLMSKIENIFGAPE